MLHCLASTSLRSRYRLSKTAMAYIPKSRASLSLGLPRMFSTSPLEDLLVPQPVTYDYTLEKKTFQIPVPEYFNFATDVFDVHARNTPDKLAMWWVGEMEKKVTYAELAAESRKAANVLQDIGINKGDRVMVVLGTCYEWWVVSLACMRLGAVMSPGTSQLTATDLDKRFSACTATTMICSAELHGVVTATDALVSQGKASSLQTRVIIGAQREGWLNYESLMDAATVDFTDIPTKQDDMMCLYFTSGTTGLPKMTKHTFASFGLGHDITGKYWLDLNPADLHWTISDSGWAKAAYGTLFGPWSQGVTVFVLHTPRLSPDAVIQTLENYPVSTFCAPPTLYRMLVRQDINNITSNNKALRHCVSAGEPLNPEVIESWARGTGQFIHEGYGQSESSILVCHMKGMPMKPGSMGRPSPGYDVAIIDNECETCADGVEGDIAVKVKPQYPVGLFSEYWLDEERTAKCFKGDYYLTGDRGIRDKDGDFWFVGRSDDVIITSGYRVGPFEVESALVEHAAVVESAVVSSPDELRGEIVKAFVVLGEGYEPSDALIQELQDHTKTVTAPYKYPRAIEFVTSLPKTISGKIRRVELRDKEWGKQ